MVFKEQPMGLNWLHIKESEDCMNTTIPQRMKKSKAIATRYETLVKLPTTRNEAFKR
jgi:hypothetical protein